MKKYSTISQFALGLSLAVLLVAPRTRAAEPPGDEAAARGDAARGDAARVEEASTHFDRALTLFDEGDFAAALVDFRRAQAIKPSYKLRFNIGGVCLELRDYACAFSEFEAYLDEGGGRITGARREDVRKKIARAALRIATLEIVTTPGAEIAIDDEAVGVAPLAHRVIVNAGRHRISAQKAGWTNAASVVEASATDALRVSLELREIEPRPVVPTLRVRDAEPPPRSRWTTASFVGLGAGGALLTTAVIAGLSAGATRDDVRATRFAGAMPPADLAERADGAQSLVTAANVFGVAAIVTIGVTLGVTLFRPNSQRPQARIGINPSGGGIHGTF